MKKNVPNQKTAKTTGRVLGRKLAREVSLETLRTAVGGLLTEHFWDTSDPILGEDVDHW